MSLGRRPTQYEGVLPKNPPNVIFANRAPVNGTDKAFVAGDLWVNQTNLTVFLFAGVAGAIWIALGTGATGGIVTINSNAPIAGDYVLAGTANQITITETAGTSTFTIPAAFIAPGSIEAITSIVAGTDITATVGDITADAGDIIATLGDIVADTGDIEATLGSVTAGTTLTATLGEITAMDGNLVLATAGNKIIIEDGVNASVGVSGVMAGTPGAVTVATTACSATAQVNYCRAVTGGTPGHVSITAQDGTGFTLTSTGNETSTFNWWIINA